MCGTGGMDLGLAVQYTPIVWEIQCTSDFRYAGFSESGDDNIPPEDAVGHQRADIRPQLLQSLFPAGADPGNNGGLSHSQLLFCSLFSPLLLSSLPFFLTKSLLSLPLPPLPLLTQRRPVFR